MKLRNNIRLFITCDSGAGAGKTTASKFLSKRYSLNLLTSGLLYRMVAYKLLSAKETVKNVSFLINVCYIQLSSLSVCATTLTSNSTEHKI